jgi:hypothetical protein
MLAAASTLHGREVTIVENGQARAAIYTLEPPAEPKDDAPKKGKGSKRRHLAENRLADSVADLAHYLEKMSGAKIQVFNRAPEPQDKLLPILVGELATKAFGPPSETSHYKQAWRLVISDKGIGFSGESDEAASYAIYELLDRLGCRWYMPSEMGEVIPSMKTIRLPAADDSEVPATICRKLGGADNDFKRRNRVGGMEVIARHALEFYLKKVIADHPDWQGMKNGQRNPKRLCWANPEAADAVADVILARLDRGDVSSVSLSPDDGADFCQCEKCKALDAGDFDPSMNRMSITDRYIHFCNQIAEKVGKKHPELLMGFLAYVQYTRPPVREKPLPNLIPEIAPITYCRAHAMTDPICPSRQQLLPILEGWAKVAPQIAYYNYMFHLAEPSVPYPMMKQMSEELPILYAHHVKFWQPENMPNFESALPGLYLSIRMSWHTQAQPKAILDEFFTRFYGAASVPMRRYWQTFDDAWNNVPDHAGCGFGYARRFPPDVMRAARQAIDEALSKCGSPLERDRVQLENESLIQFEAFMKMRRDFYAGRFATLEHDHQDWAQKQTALGQTYHAQHCFSSGGFPEGMAVHYANSTYLAGYKESGRISREFRLVPQPIASWRWQADPDKKGTEAHWEKPDFDDRAWKITDPCADTWAYLGLMEYHGVVWYRSHFQKPETPAGKKVFLFLAAADGLCQVFVNGKGVPLVGAKSPDEIAKGLNKAHSFDITEAIQPGDNQVSISVERKGTAEVGTGGLMGPVMLYSEK